MNKNLQGSCQVSSFNQVNKYIEAKGINCMQDLGSY